MMLMMNSAGSRKRVLSTILAVLAMCFVMHGCQYQTQLHMVTEGAEEHSRPFLFAAAQEDEEDVSTSEEQDEEYEGEEEDEEYYAEGEEAAGAVPEGGQGEGQQLDRETIEYILKVVSDDCGAEMSQALKEQTELSDDCRSEIQRALQGRMQQDKFKKEREEEARKAREAVRALGFWADPFFLVFTFLAVLIGGFLTLTWYVSEAQKAKAPKAVKKKGKKWQKKQMMKQRNM
eukprot:g4823.t1